MSLNPQLDALQKLGQSIWYDNLSRDVLRSGELKTYLDQGVTGLTSNPTIFKQAIADTKDYDDDVRSLAGKGLGTEDVCEELMIQDVAAAADLLRPIYERTAGADGCASIEVSPFLANDTQATVTAAKRLWSKLRRPNVMIKIPATPEGLPAIEQTLAAGINVNVTLIFSVDVHRQVMSAYLKALESLLANGQPINRISSVASFFVSRVDAICEKKFEELAKAGRVGDKERQVFFGKVGIANSKLAYAAFEEIFGGSRAKALLDKGARVQRPLWASTGTKNPALKPTLYVEELAGRLTVNTMPPATLKATIASATIAPKLHSGLAEAKALLAEIDNWGLGFAGLLHELQLAGVKLFADAYRDLLTAVENKMVRSA